MDSFDTQHLEYIIWQEGVYFVSQCLTIELASFGYDEKEARGNLFEALKLYFEQEEIEFDFKESSIEKEGKASRELRTSKELEAFLTDHKFIPVSKKGKHAKFKNESGRVVILPVGKEEIPQGALKSIFKQIGVVYEEY